MKILITGGAGFIGSHIVDKYILLGHEVVVVDNLSTGKKEHINKKAKFYELDICDPKLKDIFCKEKPEIVSHHAAQMNITKSVEEPIFDAQVNVIGSLNIIQYSVKNAVRKIIFASSGGAVYGEPQEFPVKETHRLQPISPYGASKLAIEKYLFATNYISPIDYSIMRYANVYGPRQSSLGEAGVCSIFINKMINNKDCILYGFGEAIRDYIYVGDIVEANVLVLDKGSKDFFNFKNYIQNLYHNQ